MGERGSVGAVERWRVAALGVGDRIYPPLAHPGRGMGNAEGEGSQIRTSNVQHPTRQDLQTQEDFFAVKKMTEQNSQTQSDQRNNEIAEDGGDRRVEEGPYVAAGEPESKPVEVN